MLLLTLAQRCGTNKLKQIFAQFILQMKASSSLHSVSKHVALTLSLQFHDFNCSSTALPMNRPIPFFNTVMPRSCSSPVAVVTLTGNLSTFLPLVSVTGIKKQSLKHIEKFRQKYVLMDYNYLKCMPKVYYPG